VSVFAALFVMWSSSSARTVEPIAAAAGDGSPVAEHAMP
jgi:hypothetical protein